MLDKDQVSLIESDVAHARITLLQLSQELVDHICCEVEREMSNGKNFEEAYAIVKEQTGIKVLQKIQENTLYLIDKKYALMKTTMKIIGNLSLAMLGLGTVMKIYHWPGAAILLLLGFVLVCLVFFPGAIYVNYYERKENKQLALNLSILFGGIAYMAGILFKVQHWPYAHILLLSGFGIILGLFLPMLLYVKLKEADTKEEKRIYVLGAFALLIFELSAMFKIFHWPGAGPMILVGSIMLIAIFLPLFTGIKIKKAEINTGQFIFLIIIFMYAVVLTALMTLNVSVDVLKQFVKEEANAATIVHYFEKKQQQPLHLIGDSLKIQQEKQVIEDANKLKGIIENIKLKLIQNADKVDDQTAMRCVEDPALIHNKDNDGAVNEMLENNNGLIKSLREELDKFRENTVKLTSSNDVLARHIEMLLSTSVKSYDGNNASWEEANFSHNPVIISIARLSNIEKNVRIVQSVAVHHIHQQNS